jgi:hypothetical protein
MSRYVNKSVIVALASMCSAWSVWGGVINEFSDDFSRLNVANTSDGSAIGASYVITSTSGDGNFSIDTQKVRAGGATGNHRVLSYQGFEAENTGGKSFEVSADITLGVYNQTINSGLAFNFQNANNFYYARLVSSTAAGANNGALQFGQMVAGVGTTFAGNVTGLNVATGVVYNVTVSSSTPGSFTYGLTGGTLNLSGSFSDAVAGGDFSDGYVGLYQITSNGNTQFDNLSITVIPEPATLGLFVISSGLLLLIRKYRG